MQMCESREQNGFVMICGAIRCAKRYEIGFRNDIGESLSAVEGVLRPFWYRANVKSVLLISKWPIIKKKALSHHQSSCCGMEFGRGSQVGEPVSHRFAQRFSPVSSIYSVRAVDTR
jgi:hypothetical protein